MTETGSSRKELIDPSLSDPESAWNYNIFKWYTRGAKGLYRLWASNEFDFIVLANQPYPRDSNALGFEVVDEQVLSVFPM